MKIRKNIKCLVVFFVMVLVSHLQLQAQIYAPEGLNMPGSWDNWTNPPENMIFAGNAQTTGGLVQVMDLEKPVYQTHFFVASNGGEVNPGEYQFKFTSGPLSNIWQNQWGAVTVIPNTIQEYTYGVSGDNEPTHNTVQLQGDKWYYVNWDNIGYENTKAVFMELDAEAVDINSLTQSPLMPTSNDQVEISIQTSEVPSSAENIYLRYSSNNFLSSSLVAFEFDNNEGVAVIPAMEDGTQMSYDVFSTVFDMPSSNYDLITLKVNNNLGNHYQYHVGDSLSCGSSLALLSTQPVFPLDNSEVIITFNAALGNGGLAGYTGDVYAHTGVITSESTGDSDWKYVKTNWGQNTADTKLTRIDNDLYELIIPNIRAYYGVPTGEEILKIAFVFRSDVPVNGSSYLEGKTSDNQDIFTTVYDDVLHVKITYPSDNQPLLSPNSLMPVCVSALQADSIQLFVDSDYIGSSTDDYLLYGLNTSNLNSGRHWVIAKAFGEGSVVLDSVMVYLRTEVIVEELPPGLEAGINYIDDHTVTLVLWDPARLKDFAFVLGDFNNWMLDDASYMKRTPDGSYFWITLSNLSSSAEYAYQYLIDGDIKIADPFCDKILDPWNDKWIPQETYPHLKDYPFGKTTGIVSVFETARQEYNWQIENFVPQAVNESQSNLVIYELLIRDFVGDSRIASVADSLDYIKNLGVNAIELMPVNEFEGNDSWGYNPSFYFAPDKAYGSMNDYKSFVDACHEQGIAVILDVVFNHSFGQSPLVQMYWDASLETVSDDNPWYNQFAPHPLSPGYDFNHESPYTKSFVKRVLKYWMQEYKIDGFRFDLSKGFTQNNTGQDINAWSQYDQSRVDILNDYYQFIKGESPNAYVILEHLANNDEETSLANSGMLLWGNMSSEFGQATMGWQDESDYSWAYYTDRGFTYPNLIPFMESHDEERLMYQNLEYGNSSGGYDIQDEHTALGRISAVAPMYFMVPGPKMIWQFGELGYDYSINYCSDGTVSEDCRTSKKPIRWDYFNHIERQEVYHTFAAMAQLKTSQEAFVYGEYSKDLGGMVKRAWLSHSSLNVCAGSNFDVVSRTVTPNFQHDGIWYNYFTGESINVSGAGSIDLEAGGFYVYTDHDFGRPYVKLDITILREEDHSPIHGAIVQLQNLVAIPTDVHGKAVLLPFSNRNYRYTITAGHVQKKGTLNILEDDVQKTILMKNVSAVDDHYLEEISIFPNPAGKEVNIAHANGLNLLIYSLKGQLLLKERVNTDLFSVSLESLKSGLYILKLKNDDYFVNKKLIIQ